MRLKEANKSGIFQRNILGCFIGLGFVLNATAQEAKIPQSKSEKYLYVVRRSVDSLLANAVDRYGKEHSGMIISVLNCRDASPLTKQDLLNPANHYETVTYPGGIIVPKSAFGYRKGDRTGLGGSNVNLQQDLYRTMGYLSDVTGNPLYKKAAQKSLEDFLRITQHPETGLLAWGEHLSWNCLDDRLGNTLDSNNTHEPKRKFIFFDQLYRTDPARVVKYAHGLWDHQIADKNTGEFNRHAKYDRHRPGFGNDFPKEGGYFIDTWGRAYEKTKDPEFSRAVKVLSARYLNRTNGLGLMDWDVTGAPERKNLCVTLWLMSLSMDQHDVLKKVDPSTAAVLNQSIKAHDKGFLLLKHEIDDPEKGFVCFAFTDTGAPRPQEHKNSMGYSKMWGMGYGINTTSMFGILAYKRLLQLKTGPEARAYKQMVIKAANIYHRVAPDPLKEDIWAGEYGMAIFLQLAAFRLTSDSSYLQHAQTLADQAISVFWADGKYCLPKSSSLTDYYDCGTYADTLIASLLALHEHSAGMKPVTEISDLNR